MASFFWTSDNNNTTNNTLQQSIFTHVTQFSAAYVPGLLDKNSTAMCYWPNTSTPLVAEKYNPQGSNSIILSLNAYCISKTVSDYGYESNNTSVPHLVHNCIKYAAAKSSKRKANALNTQLYKLWKSRKDVLVDTLILFSK